MPGLTQKLPKSQLANGHGRKEFPAIEARHPGSKSTKLMDSGIPLDARDPPKAPAITATNPQLPFPVNLAPGPFVGKFQPTVIGTSKALTSKDAAKNAAKKLKATNVAIWSLKNTSIKAPESFEALMNGESVFDQDDRKRVSAADYGPGGKYRSIVKLFLIYETKTGDQKTLIATGWLIAADLVVTAGHCVFDWEHNLNQVTQVKAYIGYEGRASIGSPNVQFRKGIKVATTYEWMRSGEPHHDVSFIKLQKPFKGVVPFKFRDTPVAGNTTLGVVGYPGDLNRGEYMYECFMNVQFNVVKTQRMLQYQIDTFGGNSGAPVIRRQDGIAIAVHVMGGKTNQASLIGPMGNIFEPYIQALTVVDDKMAKAPLELSWVEMTAGGKSEATLDEDFEADPNGEAVDYDQDAPESGDGGSDPASEAYRFKQTFTKGYAFTQVFQDRLSSVGLPPSFGLTGRMSALYGHALLQTLRKSTKQGVVQREDAPDGGEGLDQGALGRAVLTEAALDTIFALDKNTMHNLQIMEKMSQHSSKTEGAFQSFWTFKPGGDSGTIGDKIATVAISTAAGAIISGVTKLFQKKPKKESGENEADGDFVEDFERVGGAEQTQDLVKEPGQTSAIDAERLDNMPKVKTDIESLIRRLIEASENGPNEANVISLLREAAVTESLLESIPVLVEALEGNEAGDAADQDQEAGESNELASGLKYRMILGEAALETLLEIGDFTEAGQSESFFGKLWTNVKKVGQFVAQAAPSILVSAAGNAIMGKVFRGGKREVGNGSADQVKPDGSLEADADEIGQDGEFEVDEEDAAVESFEDWFRNKSSEQDSVL